MKNYTLRFQYSTDGKSWVGATRIFKAESDEAAIAQAKAYAEYVKDIRIMSRL